MSLSKKQHKTTFYSWGPGRGGGGMRWVAAGVWSYSASVCGGGRGWREKAVDFSFNWWLYMAFGVII